MGDGVAADDVAATVEFPDSVGIEELRGAEPAERHEEVAAPPARLQRWRDVLQRAGAAVVEGDQPTVWRRIRHECGRPAGARQAIEVALETRAFELVHRGVAALEAGGIPLVARRDVMIEQRAHSLLPDGGGPPTS